MRNASFMSRLSAPLVAAALTLAFASAARANIAIAIDKSTQQMTVAIDGTPRYTWPVSTGRPGYDTPNGNFKPNRMDADHLSQEWDNAPMPHTIFFDLHGHAIHGFFDVKHLGLPVSHGCVRLSPDHAATLFDLVKAQGMANTSVTVAGVTPSGGVPMARARQPDTDVGYAPQPLQVAPQYAQQPPQYGQPGYGQPAYGQPAYQQPAYGQPVYVQRSYGQPQAYYGQPVYQQPQSYYAPGYPPQPPPVYRQW
jgi:hypothetical protein